MELLLSIAYFMSPLLNKKRFRWRQRQSVGNVAKATKPFGRHSIWVFFAKTVMQA
jgi:hypothetical protein